MLRNKAVPPDGDAAVAISQVDDFGGFGFGFGFGLANCYTRRCEMTKVPLATIAALVSALAAGCGRSTLEPGNGMAGGDGTGSAGGSSGGCQRLDSSACDPTGDTVLVDSAIAFAVDSSGGGLPQPRPQGAACDPRTWTYAVGIGASQLMWDRCNVAGTGSQAADYTRSTGSRTLSPTELDKATSAARMVRVSSETRCGADKPTLHMSVTAPAGTTVYGDDFYACLKRDHAYVESGSLDNLHYLLSGLVIR